MSKDPAENKKDLYKKEKEDLEQLANSVTQAYVAVQAAFNIGEGQKELKEALGKDNYNKINKVIDATSKSLHSPQNFQGMDSTEQVEFKATIIESAMTKIDSIIKDRVDTIDDAQKMQKKR